MKKFAHIQKQLCVSPTAVAECCKPLEDQAWSAIKKGLERFRSSATEAWKYYDDPADNRRKWLVVDALPEQYKLRLEYCYGDIWLAYLWEYLVEKALGMIDAKDAAFFMGLKPRQNNTSLTQVQVAGLVEACGWMRLCCADWWHAEWNGKLAFYTDTAQIIKRRELYGLKVSTDRTLDRKVKRWLQDGREGLLPGTLANDNAKKVCELGLNRLIDLYASPQKPDFVAVTRIYNTEAPAKGWAQLSEERVRQLLSSAKIRQISYGHRNGTEAMRQAMERSVKRRRPSFPDALWVMDGTTVQLLYLDGGKVRSELYVYYVIDAATHAVIGYAIGSAERSTLVQAALRTACKNTMKLPHQVQYDNSSANKSVEVQSLLGSLAQVGFPTAPYNGKAKVIEQIQGAIEGQMLRYFPNWKGGNITAKSIRTRANVEAIGELMRTKDMPTRDGVMAQVRLSLEVWNNSMGKKANTTRIDLYKETEHPKRREIDYLMLVDLFWVDRREPVTYTKDGITIQVDGERYTYEVEAERGVEDMNFRMQHLGDKFSVKYDPDDLDQINLYLDGGWVATANKKYELPMAVVDMAPGEGQIIAKNIAARRAYIARQREEMEAITEAVRAEGLPMLSHELVHKDAYNRMEKNLLDDLLGIIEEREERPRARKVSHALYTGDDADGSIIQ